MLRISHVRGRLLALSETLDGILSTCKRCKSELPGKSLIRIKTSSKQSSVLYSNRFRDENKSEKNTRKFDERLENAKKLRSVQIQVNRELNEQVLKDIEQDFDLICKKIKHKLELDSVILIYFPNIFVSRQKIDEFLSEFLTNWWTMLEPKLVELSPSVVSDLFFTLWKLNKQNEQFLIDFGLDNVLKLAEITLKDVDFMHAKKLETVLKVLNSATLNLKEKSNKFLNEKLLLTVEKWILNQNSANSVGIIFEILAEMNVKKPTDQCLNVATDLCLKQFDMLLQLNPNDNETLSKQSIFNFNALANSFIAWNYNAELNRKEFWTHWFSILNHLRPAADEIVQANLNYTSFRVMLKFDCFRDFETFMDSWSTSMKRIVSFMPLNKIQTMLTEAKAKFHSNPDIFNKVIPADVLNVLENRFSMAKSFNAVDENIDLHGNKEKYVKHDVFYTLWQTNKNTNGLFMERYEWKKLRYLIEYAFKDVESLNSQQFYNILKMLENRIDVPSRQEVPIKWLNGTLKDFFEKWISTNFQTLMANDNRRIGGILTCLSELNVYPSKECLNLITKICAKELNADERSKGNVNNRNILNLLNISEAFLNWGIDPEMYSKNFWPLWYEKLSANRNNFNTDRLNNNILIKLHKDSFLVAVKFNRQKEFENVKNEFSSFVTKYSTQFSPASAYSMLIEAKKKYDKNGELVMSSEVANLLDERLRVLVAEKHMNNFVIFLFTSKWLFWCYLMNELAIIQGGFI